MYLISLNIVSRDVANFVPVVLDEPPVRVFLIVDNCKTFTGIES